MLATVDAVTQGVGVSPASPIVSAAWPPWLAGLLLAGVAVRLSWLAIGMFRLRRLRHAGAIAEPDHYLVLQQRIGTNAEARYIAGFAQPVTFGLRRPVILLPESLAAERAEIREAVLAHELLHVRRRDWAWVLVEEIARGLFWFHPAMWWLISRIQLAREEVVDALAVAATGRRRTYVEALMAFADGVPLAPAFARRRHLFRRMVLISREDVMTAKRRVVSSIAMVALMAIGGWYALGAFPLVEARRGQILQQEPGPLEISAKPITAENPVPWRSYHEPARYPAEAAAENARLKIILRTTLDAAGSVAEARVVGLEFRLNDGRRDLGPETVDKIEYERRAKPVVDAAVDAATAALARWRYDAPAEAPVSFDVTFFFSPGVPVSDTPGAAIALDRITGAIRVGKNVAPPPKIKDVRPIYPPEAKEARVQGVVVAEIRIDETGRVAEAHIVRSVPALDEAALMAIRQWEFRATLLNGVPTPVIMTVTVQFRLN